MPKLYGTLLVRDDPPDRWLFCPQDDPGDIWMTVTLQGDRSVVFGMKNDSGLRALANCLKEHLEKKEMFLPARKREAPSSRSARASEQGESAASRRTEAKEKGDDSSDNTTENLVDLRKQLRQKYREERQEIIRQNLDKPVEQIEDILRNKGIKGWSTSTINRELRDMQAVQPRANKAGGGRRQKKTTKN